MQPARLISNAIEHGAQGHAIEVLYIARAIVMAHGGTLEVESEDGRTTFRMTLPPDARLGAELRAPALSAAPQVGTPASRE